MAKKGRPKKPAAGVKATAKQLGANKGGTIKKSGSRGKAAAWFARRKTKLAKTAAQLAPKKKKTKVKKAAAVAVKRRGAMAAAAAGASSAAAAAVPAAAVAAGQPLLEAGRTMFCFDTSVLIGHPRRVEWAWEALERAGGSSGCLALVPLVRWRPLRTVLHCFAKH
jgi:hypothetical protein